MCREAPHQTHFANWYRNANEFNAGDWKLLDRIAGLWSAAHPTEHGPLLLLAAQAEERDAYTTAIKHLSAARRLGAPVSEVDHARRRLTVRKALRHLKERNQKGAWADIAELAEIPGGKEGNSKVVRHALMWFAHRMAAQETVAAELKKELDRDAGSPLTSALLLESLHDRIRRSLIPTDLLRDAVGKGVPPDAVWNAVTSGIRISGEFGLGFFLPHLWKDLLVQHLSSPGITVDPDDLRVVGGLVIRSKFRNLLLVISHLGLASGRHAAWFLAMRAAGLSPWKFHGRSHTCWRLAVYELNRTNDVALRSVIHEVNAARHLPLPMDLMASLSWPVVGGSPAEVAQVARRESSIPINGIEAKDFKDGPYAVPFRCECERCRRAREERAEMESWRKSARGNAPGREPDAEGKGRVAHVAYGDYDPDDYEDDDYGDYDPGDYEDDDYEDDDYEDDDYDDRDSDGKGLVALPQDIMEELFQIVQRFLRPDGSMPDPAELWRLAPGPLRKVLDKLEASGIPSRPRMSSAPRPEDRVARAGRCDGDGGSHGESPPCSCWEPVRRAGRTPRSIGRRDPAGLCCRDPGTSGREGA
ncbi:MAG: hypothetical protein FJ109_11490 [Deltaproteobacteria bacterium]|nr:hypothetical protein [Deltaproteobacteria bacterium]